jgi:hypothetical protein
MRIRWREFVGLIPLLIGLAACSETDLQTESSQVNTEELVESDESLARREDCELSDGVEHSIRVAEFRLSELLARFSERHPEVVAARQNLAALEEAALSDCVEQIQFR